MLSIVTWLPVRFAYICMQTDMWSTFCKIQFKTGHVGSINNTIKRPIQILTSAGFGSIEYPQICCFKDLNSITMCQRFRILTKAPNYENFWWNDRVKSRTFASSKLWIARSFVRRTFCSRRLVQRTFCSWETLIAWSKLCTSFTNKKLCFPETLTAISFGLQRSSYLEVLLLRSSTLQKQL